MVWHCHLLKNFPQFVVDPHSHTNIPLVSLIVCVSLMTYDVKNLFICLFATYVTYLVRYLL